MHVALPKWPINQFKPIQQSRQKALRAYCPNIYCELRHNSQNGASHDTPDCSADMHEFKTSLVLTSFYSILINLTIVIICFQFDDEKDEHFWQLGLIIQVISCVFHPLIEFLLSAKVRYFIKDRIEGFSGGITSDTVIVT